MNTPHFLIAKIAPVVLAIAIQLGSGMPCEKEKTLPPINPIVPSPLIWSVAAAPLAPVRGTDDKFHVIYELRLTNVTTDMVHVISMQAVDPAQTDHVLAENHVVAIDGTDVSGKFRRLGFELPKGEISMTGADYTDRLRPGQSALAYFNLVFSERDEIPAALATRITSERTQLEDVSLEEPEPTPQVVTVNQPGTALGGLVEIQSKAPISLGPPLKGDRWVDGDGCCRIIGPHRYTLLPISGIQRPPEHFAIDFLRFDQQGRAFEGDSKVLSNWICYNADVIAAESGTVVQARDGLPDGEPGSLPNGITFDEASGNYVIVDMGHGHFALYAHLIPHSIVVSVGQSVARGQLLGKLGNSGNSDAPHLHFQVMDRPSSLDADGLPFVFDHMALQGTLTGTLLHLNSSMFAGVPVPVNIAGAGPRSDQMPQALDLLAF